MWLWKENQKRPLQPKLEKNVYRLKTTHNIARWRFII